MATLSPLGWLVIYIALAATPPSMEQFTVHFSSYNRMTFHRQIDGSWYRINDLGEKIYARQEGTKLIFSDEVNPPETMDLGLTFVLTGKEDWSKSAVVYSKDKMMQLDVSPGKARMVLKVTEKDSTGEILITWQ